MARKVYVKVNADFSTDGAILPRYITWINGHRYEITRILQSVRAASTKVGGCGIRYTVMIEGKERYIFRDEDKWFVEAKN